MTDASGWAAARERGGMLGLRLSLWVYRRCGRPVAGLFVLPAVLYFFATDGPGRRACDAYWRRVDPRGALGGRLARGLRVLRVYRAFATNLLDRADFWAGRIDRYHFDFAGRDELREALDAGRGALLLGAHLGSFDALRALATRRDVAVHVVMYTEHAARINAIFRSLSGQVRLRVIPLDPRSPTAALEVRRRVERGGLVAVLADRIHPAESREPCWVPFLGDPAPFPPGPFLLAALLRCPVFSFACLRTGVRRYDVRVEKLFDRVELPRRRPSHPSEAMSHTPPRHSDAPRRPGPEGLEDVAARFAERLGVHCRRHPEQWFNFFDFWRDEAASGPSPP